MKHQRQEKLLELIRTRRLRTQAALVRALHRDGFEATQSIVSRDVAELGITKANGYYTLPQVRNGLSGFISVDRAGDALLVVKTETGLAQPVALTIDRAKIPEVVGTIAGDDTIFVAVKEIHDQRLAMRQIVELFSPGRF
jgi:transcriptional regulator of arginine metabolism